MKRPLSNSLSRLTLRLPRGAEPRGCATLRSSLKLEELEGRDLPAPVVYNPIGFGCLGYAQQAEYNGLNSGVNYSGFQSFTLGESGCITFATYTVDLVSTNGSLAIDETIASTNYAITTTHPSDSHLTLTGNFSALQSFFSGESWSYTPDLFWSGTDTVALTLTDNFGTTNTGNLTIHVLACATAPTVPNLNPVVHTAPGVPVALNIGTATVTDDFDGSESLRYAEIYINPGLYSQNGTPGFAFNYGTYVDFGEGGVLTVSIEELANLTVTPVSPFLSQSTFTFNYSVSVQDVSTGPFGGNQVDIKYTDGQITISVDPVLTWHAPASATSGAGGVTTINPFLDLSEAGPLGQFGNLTLTTSSGFWSVLFPSDACSTVSILGNGTSTLTITGYDYDIQYYLSTDNPLFVSTSSSFSGNLTLQADYLAGDGRSALATAIVDIQLANMSIDYSGMPTTVPENQISTFIVDIKPTLSDPLNSTGTYTLRMTWSNGVIGTVAFPIGRLNVDAQAGLITITGTLSEIQQFFDQGGMTLYAAEYYSGTITLTMELTAPVLQVEDPARVETFSYTVFVSPVAGSPTLATTTPQVSGAVNSTVSLAGVFGPGTLADPDGSEAVEYVEISIPSNLIFGGFSGFDFNHGSYDSERGVLTVAASDFADLSVSLYVYNPPGTYNFAYSVFSVDRAVNAGGDVETSVAQTDGTLTIAIQPSVFLYTDNVYTIGPNGSAEFSPYLSIFDPYFTDPKDFSLTLTADHASFFLPPDANACSSVRIAGNGTGTVTLTGTYYDILSYVSTYQQPVVTTSGYLGNLTLGAVFTTGDGRSSSTTRTSLIAEPPSITVPTLTGTEGGVIDLGGGKYVAQDPFAYSFDTHVVTFSAPAGTFAVDTSSIGRGGPEVIVESDGSVTIRGFLAEVNAFLATPGSVTYTPEAGFGGILPVIVTLYQESSGEGGGCGPAFSTFGTSEQASAFQVSVPNVFLDELFQGTSTLIIAPVADSITPIVRNTRTPQNVPVALTISLPSTPSDPSESVTIFIRGVPAGASLNNGTNLGGGVWQLTPTDLAGLTFTPPAGASGSYTLSVEIVVTDVGDPTPGVAPPGETFRTALFGGPSAQQANSPSVSPSSSSTTTNFTVTVDSTVVVSPPTVPPSPPPSSPPPPPVILPPPPPPTDFGTTTTTTLTTGTSTPTTDTTTPTTTSSVIISQQTAAAFGLIPAVEQKGELASESLEKQGALPPLGSPGSAATVATTSFAAGREKHPLQPIQALEHESATTLFEGSGDSIPLVDQLYRDATPPTPPTAEPKSNGEPSTSAVPRSSTPAPTAAAVVTTAIATSETVAADGERISAEVRSDYNEAPEKSSSWSSAMALGLLPLLSTILMTEPKRSKPTVSRAIRHLLFKPRTREGVS